MDATQPGFVAAALFHRRVTPAEEAVEQQERNECSGSFDSVVVFWGVVFHFDQIVDHSG